MFKNEFIENFYMLQDDLNILSKYGIAVDDIGMYNCVFCNKKIYHIDYGDFKRSTDSFKINNDVFDIFTENVVFHIYRKYQGYVPHWVLYSTDYLKFLEKNMDEQETVKQFIKKFNNFV